MGIRPRETMQARGFALFEDQMEKLKYTASIKGWTITFLIRTAIDELYDNHPKLLEGYEPKRNEEE